MAEGVRTAMPSVEVLEAWPPRRRRSAIRLGSPSPGAARGERACICDLAWIVGRDEKLVSSPCPPDSRPPDLARSERDGRNGQY